MKSKEKCFFERTSWFILLIFTISVLTTLLFWIVLPERLQVSKGTDYIAYYEPVARNLLAGHGLTHPNRTIATHYPPGYPFILLGIFGLSDLSNLPEDILISAFILICMGLASISVFLLAQTVWGSLPALISSLVWITYPGTLWLTKQPNSEIPFFVFFYAGLHLFWYGLYRKSQAWFIYFLSGLLIGFTMLIRPIAIGIGLVMGVILWLVKPEAKVRIRLFLITMVLIGNLAVVLPWEGWIHFKTGGVSSFTKIGYIAIKDGLTFTRLKGFRRGVQVPPDVEALMKDIYAHYDKLKSFGDLSLFLLEELRRRPLAVAKLFAIKAARSWYGTDSNRFETPLLIIQVLYLILILTSTGAAWKQGGVARLLTVSIWLVVLYFWAVVTAGLSIVRYMTPAIGLLFVLIPGLFFKPAPFKNKIIERKYRV